MRPSLSLKILLRAPFKALMTFLLIAAASFALFSRVADYAVTQREMERVTGYYRGVSALDNGVPNTAMLLASHLPNSAKYSYYHETPPTALTAVQINAFSALPGVSSTDIRYMTAGIMGGIKRVVSYGAYTVKYNYTNRFVLEGTFTGYTPRIWGSTKMNNINLTDCKLLAGDTSIVKGSNASVIAFATDGIDFVNTAGDMHVIYTLYDNPFGQSFADRLTQGDRCLIIGRWARRGSDDGNSPVELYIGDQDSIDYCDSFQLLNGKPDNYLETKEFARVRKIVDITNSDLKTFDMVYTSDMLSIPRFNEGKMEIKEGRVLTKTDTDACVVNLIFLKLNGLKVGDSLTVDLCDKLIEQNGVAGAAAVIPERYGTPVKKVKLKIVGAYLDTDAQYERDGSEWWSYSPSTIFVPQSLLPVKVPDDHGIKPGEFSVVIDDARQMEAFLDKAEPLAKNLGIQLRFSDCGWLKVKDNIDSSRKTSLITTVLYLGAAAVALLLAAYLYIGRQKKSYAIMRALGAPRNKARNALGLPFAVLSAIAIPVGGAAGMVYASKAVSSVLKNLAATVKQYIPDTSLPVGTMAVCLLFEAAFLILLAALFLGRLAKTPPLALLQGSAERGKAKISTKKKMIKRTEVLSEEGTAIPAFLPTFSTVLAMPERRGYGAARQVNRYILRHIRRAGWKTALAALLALLLTGAIGLLAVTRLSYKELFDKTKVVGTLGNYPSDAIMEAQKSRLMKNFYYSGGFFVILNDIPDGVGYPFALTNDIDRYVKSKSKEKYSIEYAKGYDSSLFSKNVPECLIGDNLANMYGVKPGDTVTLLSWHRYDALATISKDDSDLAAQLKKSSLKFKVAGVIKCKDLSIGICIYAPLSKTVEGVSEYIEYPFPVEYGEYVLADKETPDTLRSYLNELASLDKKYPDIVSYNLDTTELDNVKRVRDMLTLLFPIAAAAAIFIGMMAPGLIILQSAKEASILRILGTTKRRARCMLVLEQLSISATGLVIATIGLVIYNTGLFVRSTGTLLLCGGLYLLGCACAATVAAVAVTRHKILELLQVKE